LGSRITGKTRSFFDPRLRHGGFDLLEVRGQFLGHRGRITGPGGDSLSIRSELESFQAVSDGTVEAGSGASYYWAGKEPATQWFAAVPFGMNAQGLAAWLHGGDGLKLWEEIYAPFNLVPRPGAPPAFKWAAGSIKKTTPSTISKGSRCGFQARAEKWWPVLAGPWC